MVAALGRCYAEEHPTGSIIFLPCANGSTIPPAQSNPGDGGQWATQQGPRQGPTGYPAYESGLRDGTAADGLLPGWQWTSLQDKGNGPGIDPKQPQSWNCAWSRTP